MNQEYLVAALMHELIIFLLDDTACEYVVTTKDKKIRLLKEITELDSKQLTLDFEKDINEDSNLR